MDDEIQRISPQSEIDLQMLLTEPQWGMNIGVPEELRYKLQRIVGQVRNQEGEPVNIIESLWGLLGFYTRDIRLGNLSQFYGEVYYCQYYLDLGGDCLRYGYLKAFLKCLSLTITILETSQSRAGFLRKRQGTVTHEKYSREEFEPKKQSLFGKKQREEY